VRVIGRTDGRPEQRPRFGQNPDFSTVTDILQGRRHLLRTDDVVVTFTGPAGFGNLATQNYILPTVDSIINTAGVSSYALVSHVSTPVHPSKTALGRQRRG
jgi:hypothetical protein